MPTAYDEVFSDEATPEKKAELWDYYRELIKANGYKTISQLLAIADGARMMIEGAHKVRIQIAPDLKESEPK
jgi:hypothetical protein